MEPEVKAALHTLKELRVNGKIAILKTARKDHKCSDCGHLIFKKELHYCLYRGGAGLGDTKFPDRVHEHCIHHYLNLEGQED